MNVVVETCMERERVRARKVGSVMRHFAGGYRGGSRYFGLLDDVAGAKGFSESARDVGCR